MLVAAAVAACGTIPAAASGWYLAWLPLPPLLVLIWGIRSGTDADARGVTVRAALGSRRTPWSEIVAFDAPERGGYAVAVLASGARLRLPGVHAADLPTLVAASGRLDSAAAGEPGGDRAATGTAGQ